MTPIMTMAMESRVRPRLKASPPASNHETENSRSAPLRRELSKNQKRTKEKPMAPTARTAPFDESRRPEKCKGARMEKAPMQAAGANQAQCSPIAPASLIGLRSPFHPVKFIHVYGRSVPIDSKDDAEGKTYLGGGYGYNEDCEDEAEVSFGLTPGYEVGGEGKEVDVDGLEHELDGHEDEDCVAAHEDSVDADGK